MHFVSVVTSANTKAAAIAFVVDFASSVCCSFHFTCLIFFFRFFHCPFHFLSATGAAAASTAAVVVTVVSVAVRFFYP